jgi:general secretion pathway protein D
MNLIMNRIILSLIAAGLAGLLVSASAQPVPGNDNTNTNQPPGEQPGPPPDMGNGPDNGAPPPMPSGETPGGPPGAPPEVAPGAETAPPGPVQTAPKEPLVISPSQGRTVESEPYQSQFLPPQQPGTNVNDINLNFNRAPLEMVLNYLSDAAGFIIVLETHISSSAVVTVNGKHLTRDEAYNLLNMVLNKNGYASIRDGRTLTIMDANAAKTGQIPVKSGNNPDDIPRNAEIVTQIIPIRFVEARQLVSDLSSFVSPQATVVANEAGNSIVITDTQANIHHIAEIIKAVDDSAEAETEIQVFPLKYANPTDVASDISSVFPSSTSGNTVQTPTRFAGGGGGPGGFFRQMLANAAGGGGGGSSDRMKKATAVTAAADLRVSAVIVEAPKDLMQEIAGMIAKLDVPSDRDQDVTVIPMNNADSQAVATELQNMFQSTSSRTTSGNQNSPLSSRAQNNTQTTTSGTSGSTGFGTMGGGGRTGGGPQF